jgi:hypothetical protein
MAGYLHNLAIEDGLGNEAGMRRVLVVGQYSHLHQAVLADGFSLVDIDLAGIIVRLVAEFLLALYAFYFHRYPPHRRPLYYLLYAPDTIYSMSNIISNVNI